MQSWERWLNSKTCSSSTMLDKNVWSSSWDFRLRASPDGCISSKSCRKILVSCKTNTVWKHGNLSKNKPVKTFFAMKTFWHPNFYHSQYSYLASNILVFAIIEMWTYIYLNILHKDKKFTFNWGSMVKRYIGKISDLLADTSKANFKKYYGKI